jgi:ubiquinone/menaquinone biosynthesis C-methylase UbiE
MNESSESVTESVAQRNANDLYALGRNPAESARLQRQSDELAVDSAVLLDRVGLEVGAAAIDLGCGPRGILDLLAERVSHTGRVVGLDADPSHSAMAKSFAAEHGLEVEILTADARDSSLPAGSFDLVHARTLLINVPEPGEVVAEMVRLAKPGGHVASMEPDTEHVICYPPHAAFTRLCEIFPLVAARNGADPDVGRRVSELLRDAGLEDVRAEVRAQLYSVGHSRRTIRLDLVRTMSPQIVEMGIATDNELDELDRAARNHLDDPRTLVMSGLLFLCWGRKPA